MSQESSIQVAPDSTGKKVRNLSVYAQQSDGTVALVQMQVVSIVDASGTPVSLDRASDFEQLLALTRRHNDLLQMLVTELTDIDPTDDSSDDTEDIMEGVL